MMKRVFPVLAMTGALAASGFAQSSDNVEKAVRFRVTPKAPVVVTSTSTTEVQSNSQQAIDAELNSSSQLKVLGGYLWNNDAAQLDELGPRWRWWGNSEQLSELGPRWKWWNAAQVDELGPRWKWWNAAQVDELGPRWRWWNVAQVDELGPGGRDF